MQQGVFSTGGRYLGWGIRLRYIYMQNSTRQVYLYGFNIIFILM